MIEALHRYADRTRDAEARALGRVVGYPRRDWVLSWSAGNTYLIEVPNPDQDGVKYLLISGETPIVRVDQHAGGRETHVLQPTAVARVHLPAQVRDALQLGSRPVDPHKLLSLLVELAPDEKSRDIAHVFAQAVGGKPHVVAHPQEHWTVDVQGETFDLDARRYPGRGAPAHKGQPWATRDNPATARLRARVQEHLPTIAAGPPAPPEASQPPSASPRWRELVRAGLVRGYRAMVAPNVHMSAAFSKGLAPVVVAAGQPVQGAVLGAWGATLDDVDRRIEDTLEPPSVQEGLPSSWLARDVPPDCTGAYYHTTTYDRMEAIQSEGLRPSRRARWGEAYESHSKGRIFLAQGVEAALDWFDATGDLLDADMDVRDEHDLRMRVPVLLRVLGPVSVQPDDRGRERVDCSFFTTDPIPPNQLEFWDPRTESWAPVTSWDDPGVELGVEDWDPDNTDDLVVFDALGEGGYKPTLAQGEDAEKGPVTHGLTEGLQWSGHSRVQSILFDKNHWTDVEARHWLEAHGYRSGKIHTTDRYHRSRQAQPAAFVRSRLRTVEFGKGIKAVVGDPVQEGLPAVQENMGTQTPQPILYHGTTRGRLPFILRRGLLPRGESGVSSRNFTKTTSAVFLTPDLDAARAYAGEEDPVVIAIDVAGLDLDPDYDDAGGIIEVDLSMIQDLTEFEGGVGDRIPEELVEAVQDEIETLSSDVGDRPEPFTLEIVEVDGEAYLYAIPYTTLPVHPGLDPEGYDWSGLPIVFDDGDPRLLTTQYQFSGAIPASRIREVLVPGGLEGATPVREVQVTNVDRVDVNDDGEADFVKEAFQVYPAAEALNALMDIEGTEAGEEGEVPMRSHAQAAGVLFYHKGAVLLLLRSRSTSAGGTWSIPGGSIAPGEDPWVGAQREVREETDAWGLPDPIATYVHPGDPVYTTFIVPVDDAFEPGLNWEHQQFRWVPVEDVEKFRLHPAFALSWPSIRKLLPGVNVDDSLMLDVKNPKHNERIFRLFEARARELMPGGLGDHLNPRSVAVDQLAMGQRVELEHTPDPLAAIEIALDHLAELPDYYTRLRRVESLRAARR